MEEEYTWLNQWLSQLNNEEKLAIMDFVLLWSLFEFRAFNSNASVKAIQSKVEEWTAQGLLEKEEFAEIMAYFRHRYVTNNAPDDRFVHLQLRRNDEPALVRRVLLENWDNVNVKEVVTVLLIIVWRYRNNLFHGIKWAYKISGQLENFRASNNLLMQLLTITRTRQEVPRG